MAALPYMQLYVADYLADTAHLTTEEHGAYLLLLFNYWQTGKPLRAERLAAVTRLPNERWIAVERTLADFFYLQDGLWINDRVERDLEAVKSKSIKASDAGKASARAKASRKQGLVDGCSADVEADVQRNVNHTEADTEADTVKSSCDRQAESPKPDDVPKQKTPIKYAQVQESFNRICGEYFPRCLAMSKKRKALIVAASSIELDGQMPFKEHGLDFWEAYFSECVKNPHWRGSNDRGWRANFDFVLRPDNVIKVLESLE